MSTEPSTEIVATNVRVASRADRNIVVDLVSRLLTELGGTPLAAEVMGPVFEQFADGGDAGFVAVGESDGLAVAVCTISYLQSLRTGGKYAIIQEMFVAPESRSTGVGMEVLRFALDHAVANGCRTVELGAPYHGDRQIQFYRRAGFTEVGARLRWRADS